MKIQVFSDLHLEFCKTFPKITPYVDLLILSGDIGNLNNDIYKDFFDYCSDNWKFILVILGNHEYYSQDILTADSDYNTFFNTFDNIFLLQNNTFEYEDFIFIGSTYWTTTSKSIKYDINDFYKIKNLSYKTYNALHIRDETYLLNEISTNNAKKIVIITHFPPFYHDPKNIYHKTPKYIKNYFANRLSHKDFENVSTWIYGHTHLSATYTINNTQFISNQLGYPNENIDDFEDKGLFEI